MEFKKGSIVVTRTGEYILKDMKTLINPFTFQPVLIFMVDDNGKERSIEEKDVISVKNNQLESEEP